jgi:hypothetical protein
MTGSEVKDFESDGVVFTDAAGNEVAAKRAKMVSKDSNGNVSFQSAATKNISGITTATTNTSLSVSGRVNNSVVKGKVNWGGADLTLLRNGTGYRSLGSEHDTEKSEDGVPAWMQDFDGSPERVGREQDKENIMRRLRDWG